MSAPGFLIRRAGPVFVDRSARPAPFVYFGENVAEAGRQAHVAAQAAAAAISSETIATSQAGVATAQASAATSSAGVASGAAVAAISSATVASAAAGTATAQASVATSSAGVATAQASAANSSATVAGAQASTATVQAAAALSSATIGSAAASTATAQASTATAQASTATAQASTATAQASAATSSATVANAAYVNMQTLYLGAKASNPATDNAGGALVAGAQYFNTAVGEMRVWGGAAWQATYLPASGYLLKSGGVMTGQIGLVAASGSIASLNMPQAASVIVPNVGDMCLTVAGAHINVAGVARQFAMTSGSQTMTGPKTLVSAVLQNPQMDGTPIEDPYTITDGASVTIDPADGNIQQWTLGASRTPTLTSITAGKWVELAIDDGTAYTITWTSVTWMTDGGNAPTLKTTGWTHVLLRNRGGTLYGWRLGDGG